ncbi:hypothetical protein [Paenibacillus oralis]|uniref:hypothetical protein n=1 Tax=Paenibacillus oralis TaxID=2490856 RepID=UPI0015B2F1E0|nr:hypothetical protein [Paenibacillus oralis]
MIQLALSLDGSATLVEEIVPIYIEDGDSKEMLGNPEIEENVSDAQLAFAF